MNLARVVVVGTSCSGKTTFAHRLASTLGTQCVELDSLYWGPGWTSRPEFEQDVLAAAGQPRWVIDGNYSRVRDIIWRRSTAIAWLDYSFGKVLARAFRRTVRRVVTGERLYGGNREALGATLFDVEAPLWLVVRQPKNSSRRRVRGRKPSDCPGANYSRIVAASGTMIGAGIFLQAAAVGGTVRTTG